MLFELLSVLEPRLAPCLGVASVLRRRSTPETAYEIGYVKYEDERAGVDRQEGREDCWEDRGLCVLVDIAQCL
jgi:hypothetical protein